MGKPGVTFVVCVEPGSHRLDYKSVPLFLTMRRNLGALSGATIRAYAPRPNLGVGKWLREIMEHFEVEYFDEPLNAKYASYALANKPIAFAHAEAAAQSEILVFLDTDILLWREPSEFLLGDDTDIALVADTTKTTASAGPGDPLEDYWM